MDTRPTICEFQQFKHWNILVGEMLKSRLMKMKMKTTMAFSCCNPAKLQSTRAPNDLRLIGLTLSVEVTLRGHQVITSYPRLSSFRMLTRIVVNTLKPIGHAIYICLRADCVPPIVKRSDRSEFTKQLVNWTVSPSCDFHSPCTDCQQPNQNNRVMSFLVHVHCQFTWT